MLFILNHCIISGSAEALVLNIIKIRQCFLELQLKMSGMFLRHTVEQLLVCLIYTYYADNV